MVITPFEDFISSRFGSGGIINTIFYCGPLCFIYCVTFLGSLKEDILELVLQMFYWRHSVLSWFTRLYALLFAIFKLVFYGLKVGILETKFLQYVQPKAITNLSPFVYMTARFKYKPMSITTFFSYKYQFTYCISKQCPFYLWYKIRYIHVKDWSQDTFTAHF